MRIDDQMLFLGGAGVPSGPPLPNVVTDGLTFWIHGADFPTTSATSFESRDPLKKPISISGWNFSPTNGNDGEGNIVKMGVATSNITLGKGIVNPYSFTIQADIDFADYTEWTYPQVFSWSRGYIQYSGRSKQFGVYGGYFIDGKSPESKAITGNKNNIAVTFDNNYCRIYVNGVLHTSMRKSSSASYDIFETMTRSDAVFTFLSLTVGSNDPYPFNGKSKGLLIYNRVLTIDEIQQNNNAIS